MVHPAGNEYMANQNRNNLIEQFVDMLKASGKPEKSDKSCPDDPYARLARSCGYLRHPCRVWPAGNKGATSAAIGDDVSVTIEPQRPFMGDLIQMKSIDGTGAEVDAQVEGITVGTENQVVNKDFTALSSFWAANNQLNPMNITESGPGVELQVDASALVAVQTLYVIIFGRTV